MKLSRPILWLLLGVVLVAVGFGVSQLPLAQWAQSLRIWIEALGALSFVAFALAYILAAILLVPVWWLSITGGLAFGIWGFVVVPISATLGASAAFLVSRYFARGRIREWLVHRPQYHAVDQAVSEEGWKVVALLRLSPLVPYNLMNYFCGMTGVSFPAYLVATFLGSIPVTAMYVYLGFIGQAVASGTMGWLQWMLLGIGLAATAGATVLITRRVRPKLAEAGRQGRAASGSSEPAQTRHNMER
jgi:uncharacterized membrane protein YdjX (TVP38/TMEM64 family)